MLYDKTNPFSLRFYGIGKEKEVCNLVKETLRLTRTERMVVGMTAVYHGRGVGARCGGRLILANTAMSRYAYSNCWRRNQTEEIKKAQEQNRRVCLGTLTFLEFGNPAYPGTVVSATVTNWDR